MLVPWSNSDYHLAFSGATASNEMAYSFGFQAKTSLADLSGTWSINDINAYEPNDSISSAWRVNDLSTPVKAYLKANDIDFYTVNCGSIEVNTDSITILETAVREYENGNGDNLVTPGESLYLDVKMQNTTPSTLYDLTVKLSSTSNYVTIHRDSCKVVYSDSYTIGGMSAGYYFSLTDSSSSSDDCYLMSSNYEYNAFKFSVDSSCPSGTELPFTITFTDWYGNVGTDTLTIPVQ